MSVLESSNLPLPVLKQKLHLTARMRMLSWLAVGLALAVASVIGAFSIYSVMDLAWHLTAFGRTVAVATTLLCALGLLTVGLIQAWRQSRDLGKEALAVQEANPDLGNALTASLLYGADGELTRRESSPAIVDRLVTTTRDRAEHATFTGAVSWRVPKIYALVALVLFLIAATAAQMNLRIFSLTWQRFLNPWADLPAPTWTALGAVGPFGTRENGWKVPAGAAVTVTAEVLEHDPGEAFIETRTAQSDWLRRKMYRLPAATGDRTPRYGYDLDNLLQNVEYRVYCGDAESGRLTVPVAIDPQLADLEVVITPPGFLNRMPTVLRGIGDVDALIGSTVEIRARANKPLQAGSLQLQLDGSAAATAADDDAGPTHTVTGAIGRQDYALACEAALKAAKEQPDEAAEVPIGATDHDLVARFKVGHSGHYRLQLRDLDGKANIDELRYSIRARSNNPAKVKITAPARDVSVKTTAQVAIDVTAEDDFALREVGLYLMIDRSIQRKTLQRLAAGKNATRTSLDLDLGHHSFQGGEVITYWAFAVDEDGSTQGREVTSEPQFMMTYAENDFAQENQKPPPMNQQTKKALVGLDQLIEDQKGEVRDTFALHMQMGLSLNRAEFAKAAGADGRAQPGGVAVPKETPETPAPTAPADPAANTDPAAQAAPAIDVKPEHASRATTLAATQSRIQSDLKLLIADVKAELAKLLAEAPHPAQQPGEMPGPGAGPGGPGGPGGDGAGGPAQAQNGLGVKELALLEEAAAKMDEVQPPLAAVRPDSAVKPENEALRLLSEARKLILSKSGDGAMKMALDTAQRKKQQRDRQQQDEQAQQTADQMRKIPPMLEDMQDLEDEVKKLEKRLAEAKKPEPPPQTNTPQTPEEKKAEENRRLERKQQEEENRRLAQQAKDRAQELAERTQESADRLREMNKTADANKEAQQQRDQAAEQLEKSARKLAQTGKKTDAAQTPEDAQAAQKELDDAQQAMREASDRLNQSLQSQNQQRLDQAADDARQLEQRQEQLTADTQAEQAQQTQQQQPARENQAQPAGEPAQQAKQAQQHKQAEAATANLAHEQKALETDLGTLRERLKDLAQQLEQAAPADSPQAKAAEKLQAAAKQAETRSDLQRDVANAAKELQNGNLDKAQEKQQSAEAGMAELRRQIEQAQAHNTGAERDKLNQAIDDLADLRRRINQARQTAEKDPAAGTPDQALAQRAKDLDAQVQDLGAVNHQTRRDAGEKLRQAADTLTTPTEAKENANKLNTAAQAVADAGRTLERALQNLDNNQIQKAQQLVDRTLEQQRAADQAMTAAAKAKQAQALAEIAAAEENTKQAAIRQAAAQSDQAAQQARQQQTQAAEGAQEIEQALARLRTFLNGGRDPEKTPAAQPQGESQPQQLAKTLADQFDQQKVPDATRSLAEKIQDLQTRQTVAGNAADPRKPADPPPAQPEIAAPEAARKWQEYQTGGRQVEGDLAEIRRRLDQLQAAVDQDELKRLETAKQAVQSMEQKLDPAAGSPTAAPSNPPPDTVTSPTRPDPKTPAGAAMPQPVGSDEMKQMGQDLAQLKDDLSRLNLDEKTIEALEQAGRQFKQALQETPPSQPTPGPTPTPTPTPGTQPQPPTPTGQPDPRQPGTQPQPQPTGTPTQQTGPQRNFAATPSAQAGRDQLKFVRGGLDHAIERVLEDRRISNEQEDHAPRQYDALVDKYFERLSDEQIEKQNHSR